MGRITEQPGVGGSGGAGGPKERGRLIGSGSSSGLGGWVCATTGRSISASVVDGVE